MLYLTDPDDEKIVDDFIDWVRHANLQLRSLAIILEAPEDTPETSTAEWWRQGPYVCRALEEAFGPDEVYVYFRLPGGDAQMWSNRERVRYSRDTKDLEPVNKFWDRWKWIWG